MPELRIIIEEEALEHAKEDCSSRDSKQLCDGLNETSNSVKPPEKDLPGETREVVKLFLKKARASTKETTFSDSKAPALNPIKEVTTERTKALSSLRKKTLATIDYRSRYIPGPSLIIMSLTTAAAFSYWLSGQIDSPNDQKATAISYLNNSKNQPQRHEQPNSFALAPLSVKAETSEPGRLRTSHASVIQGNKKNAQSVTTSTQNSNFACRIAAMDRPTLVAEGYSAMRRGDNEYALSALTRAARMDPNDALVRQYLAYTLVALDEPDAALTQFNAFEKIRPTVATEQIRFASYLGGTTDTKPAEQYFDQLISVHATDYLNLEKIAKRCDSLGFNDQVARAASLGLKARSPEEQKLFLELYRKLQEKGAPQPKQKQGQQGPHLT